MRFLSLFLETALVTADPARAPPILNEVYYDTLGSDAPTVFTEILGKPGTILDGWTLVAINGADREIYQRIDLTGAVVPDDRLIVIATGYATLKLVLELDFIAHVDTLAVAYVTSKEWISCEELPIEIQRLPDNVEEGRDKPYLLVSKELDSAHRATYCNTAAKPFKDTLIRKMLSR
jgi:hypothetical protein